MNTPTYRNILRLLQKWPIDGTKSGRDLGEYIRKEITSSFNPLDEKRLNLQAWDEIHASLNRIASDRYKTLYPTSSNIQTATGLTSEDCSTALSDEFRQQLEEEEERNVMNRLKRSIKRKEQ